MKYYELKCKSCGKSSRENFDPCMTELKFTCKYCGEWITSITERDDNIKQLKEYLEKDILKLVNDFQISSGMTVTDIDFVITSKGYGYRDQPTIGYIPSRGIEVKIT